MSVATLPEIKKEKRAVKRAFDQLTDDWKGILVSDNYGVYVNWVNSRQTCLTYYIRKAKATP